MNAKQKFIAMVEMMKNYFEANTDEFTDNDWADAIAYFELLKADKPVKEKVAFTDNGKLFLHTMRNNVEQYNNLFKARDIAELAFVNSRSVSGTMGKLVNDGYVEKVGKDPIIYALTDLGKTVEIPE